MLSIFVQRSRAKSRAGKVSCKDRRQSLVLRSRRGNQRELEKEEGEEDEKTRKKERERGEEK